VSANADALFAINNNPHLFFLNHHHLQCPPTPHHHITTFTHGHHCPQCSSTAQNDHGTLQHNNNLATPHHQPNEHWRGQHDVTSVVDKWALVLHTWTRTYAIFNGYTNIPGPSHHRHPLQSHSTSQTFGGLQYINVPMIWMSCRHVRHLRRFYYVFTHHASLHLQIFDTSYPHATTHLKNLRRHAYKYPIAFPKLQVHCPTSPNILPFRSMLTLNIWYYSHTPCRLLIGSSKTFRPSSFCFLSTPNMIGTHHWRFLLCKNTHRHTFWHLSTPITLASLFASFEV